MKKHFFMYCILLLLFSCSSDEYNEVEQSENFASTDLRVQYKRGNEVSISAIEYIKTKTNNTLTVSSKKGEIKLNNSILLKNDELGTVDTSKEIVVVNEDNTKHTFKVTTPNEPFNTFTNLIIVEKGDYSYEYFLKYTFAGELPLNEETGTIDFSKFNGTIETFNADGNLIGSITIENGIITDDQGQLNPCPDDMQEPTGGDTTSGSDSSAGIPSGNDEEPINSGNGDPDQSSQFVDSNGDCGLTWSYERCGCGGDANGHPPQTGYSCCQGSPLVIRDCTGAIVAQRNSSSTTSMIKRNAFDPCNDGDAGVIIDYMSVFEMEGITEAQTDWLSENLEIAEELQDLYIDNNYSQQAEEFILMTINEMIEDDELTLNERIVQQLIIDAPDEEIENIEEFLGCFDTTQGAELTIYVDQPVRGNRKAWTIGGPDKIDVGHAFIQIRQGDINRVFGLYPVGLAKPSAPDDPRVYGDDAGHEFDLSISKDITAAQLTNIINDTIGDESSYNLSSNNCSTYSIRMAQMGGINLPSTVGSWPGGEGTNPGDLGEDIREHTQIGTTKNILDEEDYDTALGGDGNC